MSKPKASDHFQRTIQSKLEEIASQDEMFALKYANEKKSIEECMQFIFSEVQKSGRNGFTDDEVYGMAIHYYDEEDLKVESIGRQPRVVVNHVPELTDQEKEEARQKALEQLIEQEKAKLRKPKSKMTVVKSEKKQEEPVGQGSLF